MSQPELPAWLQVAAPALGAYVGILGTTGVTAGLLGPREVPRLWTRHVLNCAVVADPQLGWVPPDAKVVDVGSGAGLPGLVWAMVRPDISVICLEPLLRRSDFLTSVVADLGLGDRVAVVRGRAEDVRQTWTAVDVATSRAVAPLPKLLGWSVPLVRPGGQIVALKGASAPEEVRAVDAQALGITDLRVDTCGAGVVDPVSTVVLATRTR